MNWNYDTLPPIAKRPENSDPDIEYTWTDEVIVLCSNGDIHRSYHDGDVWCYYNFSGLPPWSGDVIGWVPLPNNTKKRQ